jgi:hypothetical protein
VEIRRLIVGLYTHFPKSPSWRFIPESFSFQDPYHPWPFEEEVTFMVHASGVVEDFMGVKIGDLNRSATAHAQQIVPRSSLNASITAIDQKVNAGEEVEFILSLREFEQNVLGGQWALKMNGAKVIRIAPVNPSMTPEMWYNDENNIRWSWTTEREENVDDLVRVRLLALKSGKLSEMVSIDPTQMQPELYNEYEEVYNLSLEWREEAEVTLTDDIQLHQNRPNPWVDETVIPFELPEAGEVTVTITSATGETIHTITKEFAAGRQQFKITNENWPAGAYYYTMRLGEIHLTKTMLILNKH